MIDHVTVAYENSENLVSKFTFSRSCLHPARAYPKPLVTLSVVALIARLSPQARRSWLASSSSHNDNNNNNNIATALPLISTSTHSAWLVVLSLS
jgi:hypothetical protein